VQATEGVPKEEVVDCPDHQPCNFIKGKPRSIICLLISEIQLSIYVICIDALSYRCWLKTLAAYISYPCPKSYLESYLGSGPNICLALLRLVEVR
jgi:hypothetical protein